MYIYNKLRTTYATDLWHDTKLQRWNYLLTKSHTFPRVFPTYVKRRLGLRNSGVESLTRKRLGLEMWPQNIWWKFAFVMSSDCSESNSLVSLGEIRLCMGPGDDDVIMSLAAIDDVISGSDGDALLLPSDCKSSWVLLSWRREFRRHFARAFWNHTWRK